MTGWLHVAAIIAGLALLVGPVSAGGNHPPLADAGLDQTVDNGTTVHLDAGSSVDADGSITAVRWSITAPDGTPVTSSCDACTRTRFTPHRTGEYAATVTVTDDDGASETDTLYVTVDARSGPAVSLFGPNRTVPNASTTFGVSARAATADLEALHWSRNGSRQRTIDLSGNDSVLTINRTFPDTGTFRLRATVEDRLGYVDAAVKTIQVLAPGSGGRSGGDFDRCPGGGHPVYNGPNGQQTGCRQVAFTTNDDQILDLGAGNNPENVRWRTSDGTLYTLDRDLKQELVGGEGLLSIDQMKEQGSRYSIELNATYEEIYQDLDPNWQQSLPQHNPPSDSSERSSDESRSSTSTNADESSSGPVSYPGDNSECPAPCEDLSKLT